jgi:hypothetical protein
MADAFSAFAGVDFVDFDALVDRGVRALGLADVAINALIGYFERHKCTSINAVIPALRLRSGLATAGIQVLQASDLQQKLGSRLRGNDEAFEFIEVPINRYLPTLVLKAAIVIGWTKSETSPPSTAISRTMVAEINMYLSDGVTNMVSTPGLRRRFMPAI